MLKYDSCFESLMQDRILKSSDCFMSKFLSVTLGHCSRLFLTLINLWCDRKLFAVGGKGFQPNIYVYSYPEREVSHRDILLTTFWYHYEEIESLQIVPVHSSRSWKYWKVVLIEDTQASPSIRRVTKWPQSAWPQIFSSLYGIGNWRG